MDNVSRFRWVALNPTSPLLILHAFLRRFDVYRRHVRAGREIEALLSLEDQQLASRGLTRAEVGRAVFAKHGVEFDRSR